MRLLAINIAFSNSDVAICFDETKNYKTLPSSAKQSENILCAVDELLVQNSIKIQDIDIMACVVGPGSFTGIRIGVALVKGMYKAKKSIKLISICSLDLMANMAKTQTNEDFWCVINALSGNLFACKYSKDGERITQPKMIFGDDIEQIKGVVFGLNNENLDIVTKSLKFDAQCLLDYAMILAEQEKFVPENEFLPIYLRKSQAESQLDENNGN